MISSFANQGTEDLFNGVDTRAARKVCPVQIWAVAQRKLYQLNAATALAEMRRPPQNRLEALKGNRKGQFSIRINQRYRVVFTWANGEADAVEVVDYHD